MYKNKNNVWIYDDFSNRKHHRYSSLNHFICIFYHPLATYWCGFSVKIKQTNPPPLKKIAIPSFNWSFFLLVSMTMLKICWVHFIKFTIGWRKHQKQENDSIQNKSFQEPSRPVPFAAAVVTLRTQEGFPNLKCFPCLWGTGSVCIFYWSALPEQPPSVKTNFHFRAANVSLTFKWRK